MKTSILIICVNYFNDADTANLISSIKSLDPVDSLEVLVVDNSERNEDAQCIIDDLSNDSIKILKPRMNLGYFGGASWALKEYLDGNEMPTWVIVCNTDLYFASKDALSSLLSKYSNEPPSIVAPAIISEESSLDQNPYLVDRPTIWKARFLRWVFSNINTLRAYEYLSRRKKEVKKSIIGFLNKNNAKSNPKRIYAPHGSLIIFNERYFNSGGNLDYGAFLFGEEIFVAETARDKGLEIIYDSSFIIIHKEHSATRSSPLRSQYKSQAAQYCANTLINKGDRKREG